MSELRLEQLLDACSDDGEDAGIRLNSTLEPLAGPGGAVKPAVYPDRQYQVEKRFPPPLLSQGSPRRTFPPMPLKVIVLDNVPSQANRLESALQQHREEIGLPEFVLDLSGLGSMPSHVPGTLSSFQFPHRNADAYLRDSMLDGVDFDKTALGVSILGATAADCGPLMSWFPQALLYGFWQSHLGKKGHQSKHARAWVSEVVGWRPADCESMTRGVKGDPLNLTTPDDDMDVRVNPDFHTEWDLEKRKGTKTGKKLSAIGHGQVPIPDDKKMPSPVSFSEVTQTAIVSFAQLRRVSLGRNASPSADAAARALLVCLGLHAHSLAFEHAFSLRSGADLRPVSMSTTWLGAREDLPCSVESASALLQEAKTHALESGVPLAGWGQPPTALKPKPNLENVVKSRWLGDTE